ncbi:hypothetical protein BN424_316 [Carnobacterium maltaromaticum LMA28]|uniref:Uncharacterized protein n=1 Tax=Carnobacterium maltaromaticum LMA28 TaxID=1234679 RepID=K8EMT4_CARML|nr:hypothetical protein [Carnobacterium maltaromaticum]CCO09796.2 hypothetical protein BN424_316 [Carnobacterium maltaromaticum LMA28]
MESNYTSLGKVKTGLTTVQGIFIVGSIYSLLNIIVQFMMSTQSMVMSEGGEYTPSMWDQFSGIFNQITSYIGVPGSLLFSILAVMIATFGKEIITRLDQQEPLYSTENAATIKKNVTCNYHYWRGSKHLSVSWYSSNFFTTTSSYEYGYGSCLFRYV